MSDEQKRSVVKLPNGTTINDVVSVTPEMGTFPYRLEPRTAREYKYGGKHGSVVFVGGYTVEDVHHNTFYLQADTGLTIDGKPLS